MEVLGLSCHMQALHCGARAGLVAMWGLSSCAGLVGLVALRLWSLISLVRDGTHVPCLGRWILNQWTTSEVQRLENFEPRSAVNVIAVGKDHWLL